MLWIAAILIIVSAYFSPAHALTADVSHQTARDAPGIVTTAGDGRLLAAAGLPSDDPVVVPTPLPALNDTGSPDRFAPEPALAVTVPLPASFWLFATALVAGLLLQRRRGTRR